MYLTRREAELTSPADSFIADDGKSSIFLESSHDQRRFVLSIDQLEKFTRYAVHVQAYNEQGAGPRSDDVTVFTLEDVPSQPPQNVQASALSSQSVMVVWSPPPLYTLHGILQGYRVFYKPVRHDEDESDSISLTTSKLSMAIFGLLKFTNYSIQVLAYTRKGEGVRSSAIYVRTQPDLPERPADIKAVTAGPNSVLVAWKPPVHANGLLKKYTIYVRDLTDLKNGDSRIDIPASHLSYLLTNLSINHKYGFRLSANTVIGDGEQTHEVSASTLNEVGARIASFPGELYTNWHSDVVLECLAVGEPAPVVTWKKRSQPITYDERVQLMSNGSLLVSDIRGSDAANYTCRAENKYGADEIIKTLLVQAPPRQPVITLAATTSSTIQVNWRSGSNGGSKIQGFIVSYKREHGMWNSRRVEPGERTYTASDLRCGTQYSFKVQAYNSVGNGVLSNIITAKTNGSTPIMPAQSIILKHVNSTWITLDLSTWETGGCPITFYDIHYQYWGDTVWHIVEAHIEPEQKLYHIDVRPATWYIVKVTAHNDAGSTECLLKFSTKTYEGNTIEPVRIVHRYQPHFYESANIMIPLCAVFVLLTVITVGVALYCRRKRRDYQYKAENASNLRKDITAESFLMSDVDSKSHSMATDHTYSPDPSTAPNNSLLIDMSAAGLDNAAQYSAVCGEERGSRSSSASDEEGNIKPYATFPKQVKPLNNEPRRDDEKTASIAELEDPDLDKLPPPPPEMFYTDYKQRDPGNNQDLQTRVSDGSSDPEELLSSSGHLSVSSSLPHHNIQSDEGYPAPHHVPSKMNKRRRPPTPPPRGSLSQMKQPSPPGGTRASFQSKDLPSTDPASSAITLPRHHSPGGTVCHPPAKSSQTQEAGVLFRAGSDKKSDVSDQSKKASPIMTISGSHFTQETPMSDNGETSDLFKGSDVPGVEECRPLMTQELQPDEKQKSAIVGRQHKRFDSSRQEEEEDCSTPLTESQLDNVM